MNRISEKIGDAFYAKKDGFGLAFFINDFVEVVEGANLGKEGFVVALEALEPEQKYLVEFVNGKESVFLSTSLKRKESVT